MGINADCSFYNVFQSQTYLPSLCRRKLVGSTAGCDSGLVEYLIGDPVADAGCKTLVQQQRFDSGRPLSQEL